jgi:hypothetical protein
MRARLASIAIAGLVLGIVPATGSKAAPARDALVCTWGGTPDAPTGVFTASPGLTNTPSAGPIEFTAAGKLAGPEGCQGTLTFRGVLDPGTSCLVAQRFVATATGFPPIERAVGTIGPLGTHVPVVLYDVDGNVVGSEQAQFLTGLFVDTPRESDPVEDCNSPEGLTRAYWSDTLELFPSAG